MKMVEAQAGPVQLRDGRWSGSPSEPAAATRDIVTLDDTLQVVGDLDDDGLNEAVVLLTHSPGVTAAWVYLTVVKREGSKLRHGSYSTRSWASPGCCARGTSPSPHRYSLLSR